ncbi:phage terminase large subunit [Patescibacteria group bacterium]|nr:phage terminase large subunit [Patescibacteria group bacterium]
MKRAKEISNRLGQDRKTLLYIEEVAYQKSFIDALKNDGYPARGMPTLGTNKESRLKTVSQYLENGQVFFPHRGTETLISQLLGFGAERHDDLVDAFTIIVGELFKNVRPPTRWPKNDYNNPESKPIFDGILDMDF